MKRKLPRILFAPRISKDSKKALNPYVTHIAKGSLIFLAGIIIGSALSVFYQIPDFINATAKLSEILLKQVPFSFGKYFLDAFLTVMTAVAIVFVLGFNAAAVPVIYAIPAFRGIGFGVMMTEIYSVFNVKGIVICILAVLPFAAFTVVSICSLSIDSLIISGRLTRYLFMGEASPFKEVRIKIYFLKFVFSTVVAAFAAFLHTIGVRLLLTVI